MPLVNQIEVQLAASERYLQCELERATYARKVLMELAPFLPHTLSRHFDVSDVWTGWGYPVERTAITLRLQTHRDLSPEDTAAAFGMIVKVAAGMLRAGWNVQPQPKIEANDHMHAMDVQVMGERPATGGSLAISFIHLPESERCKLVEEQVLLPERWEVKLRVECEGEPLYLTEGEPAPIEEGHSG